jgi:hypothetical protein
MRQRRSLNGMPEVSGTSTSLSSSVGLICLLRTTTAHSSWLCFASKRALSRCSAVPNFRNRSTLRTSALLRSGGDLVSHQIVSGITTTSSTIPSHSLVFPRRVRLEGSSNGGLLTRPAYRSPGTATAEGNCARAESSRAVSRSRQGDYRWSDSQPFTPRSTSRRALPADSSRVSRR